MTFGFENEIAYEFDFDAEALFKEVVGKFLDHAGCPYEAEINLLITDDESIREINREQRNIDAPTDVLSFPMVEYDVPGDFTEAEKEDDCFNIETGELMLGDIVLSADRIKAQAEEYGHSIRREYAFLIVHSMLHLIGYDHMNEKDRILMEEKQRNIMELLCIPRE